jgi:lipopolysaccharide assembly outer membrane protein LptD (OstA)
LKFIKSIFIYFFAAILIAVSIIGSLFAQQPVLRPDNAYPDTTLRSASLKSDTVTKKINSKGSLTSKVTYGAVDSTIFDMKNNIVFLYGNARIKYEDFEIEADYIRLDQKNNSVFAKGRINPVNKPFLKIKY